MFYFIQRFAIYDFTVMEYALAWVDLYVMFETGDLCEVISRRVLPGVHDLMSSMSSMAFWGEPIFAHWGACWKLCVPFFFLGVFPVI